VATSLVPFSLLVQAISAVLLLAHKPLCICRSNDRACALRLLVAPERPVEWRSCCFLSPYHGVLAVKGCARFARLRRGRLSPPDCCAAPSWAGSGQFRPSNWSTIMSQLSLAFDASLMIRDEQGRYLPATAEQILDAARKVIDQKVQRGAAFTSSELVKEYLIAKLGSFEHEVFSALFLDAKHRLIQYVEMFRGSIDSAPVYPREVVKEALRLNAAAVIFAHNHPSGNPEPSQADKVLTQRLKEALALVDVRSLDHIIVAGQRTVSFAELGLL